MFFCIFFLFLILLSLVTESSDFMGYIPRELSLTEQLIGKCPNMSQQTCKTLASNFFQTQRDNAYLNKTQKDR